LNLVPVFVRSAGDAGKGNAALLKLGARLWPEPKDSLDLVEAVAMAVQSAVYETRQQETLSLDVREELVRSVDVMPTVPANVSTSSPPDSETIGGPSEQLLAAVRAIACRVLQEPRSEAEFAESLGISKPQAKAWLDRLIREGIAERLSKPSRYQVVTNSGRLF